MPAVILAKHIEGKGIEVRSPLVIPEEHLEPMARVAQEQGFDLMYEFESQPPSMVVVIEHFKRAASGTQTGTLPGMTRLWVLADLEELYEDHN